VREASDAPFLQTAVAARPEPTPSMDIGRQPSPASRNNPIRRRVSRTTGAVPLIDIDQLTPRQLQTITAFGSGLEIGGCRLAILVGRMLQRLLYVRLILAGHNRSLQRGALHRRLIKREKTAYDKRDLEDLVFIPESLASGPIISNDPA